MLSLLFDMDWFKSARKLSANSSSVSASDNNISYVDKLWMSKMYCEINKTIMKNAFTLAEAIISRATFNGKWLITLHSSFLFALATSFNVL